MLQSEKSDSQSGDRTPEDRFLYIQKDHLGRIYFVVAEVELPVGDPSLSPPMSPQEYLAGELLSALSLGRM